MYYDREWVSGTVDLSLPNGVGETPECGDDEVDERLCGIRSPEEEGEEQSEINDGAQDEDGNAPQFLDGRPAGDRSHRVGHSVTDHHETDVLNPPRTRNESLTFNTIHTIQWIHTIRLVGYDQ